MSGKFMLPDRVRLAGGLACVLALSAEWGRGAEGGPFPPPPPTSELALRAPDGRLEQAFARARSWALSLVVTNGYVAHDPEPRVMHALTPDRAADLTRPLYDRDAKGEWIKAVDPRNGLEGYRASKPVPAYWGTYAPSTRPNTQGTPWSGRECFCARDIAHSVVGAHLLGLDRENLAMLRLFAKGANENTFGNNYGWPKWSYSFFGEPFYMDADWRELAMPYDIGLRCWELYRWTGQPDYLRDEDMFRFQLNLHTKFQDLPEADRTPLVSQTSKTFWDLQDQNGNGIAEEHIQLATYWEDNNDKVRLIEAGDSFSNQVRSLENLARVLEARGEPDRARPYQDRAAALRRLFHEKWYSHPDRLYIRAFDETGAPRVNWGHESSFLMLADNLTDNGPRAAAYADFIAEQLFRYGINIEATTYLPEIFYGRGRNELGWYWLQHVVKYLGPDNAGPYPETAFLLVSNVVTGLMGLQGEMQEQAFRTTPRLTAALPWAEIDHVPVGSSDLKVRHDGNTKTTATLNRGPNLTWCAGFLGIHPQLKVNGRAMAAKPRLLQGLMVSEIRVPLARGATVVVEVPAEEPGYVALGDLAATSTRGAWSKDASPRNNGSELLLLGWRAFERGLSAQPEAAATYALDGGFSRLTAMAGLDSGSAAGGAGRLTIKVDGKEVFNSGILKAENAPVPVEISLAGGRQMEILVSDGGSNSFVDLVNPILHRGMNAQAESAASVAVSLPPPPAPAMNATRLKMPVVPPGFAVAVQFSSDPALIDPTGKITPPRDEEAVDLVMRVTRPGDGGAAYSKPLTVLVPGRSADTAEQMAERVRAVPQPARRQTKLVLPAVEPGFAIRLKTGMAPPLAADGAITPDDQRHVQEVVFEIMKLADRSTALTRPLPVTIPAKSIVPLTDLAWTAMEQSHGSPHVNTSVDGNPLKVGGKVRPQGLGCHAASTITYALDGKFVRFTALAGLDGEASGGSVAFVVAGDGRELARSDVLHGEATFPVDVDLHGLKELKLTITDGGDGISCDHADWAEATLRYAE